MKDYGHQRRGLNKFMLLFVTVAFILLLVSNPSKEKHLRYLKQSQTIAFILDKLHAEKNAAFENRFVYHNYFIFSRTTYSIGDKNASASWGFAGIVF